MSKDILCNECGRFLFTATAQAWGAIGCEAQDNGFIFKIPILFTNKYERLFFCTKDCQNAFYNKNIPKDEKVSEILSDMKSKIPDVAKDFRINMEALSDALRNQTSIDSIRNRLTYQFLNWGAFCNVYDKRSVLFDELYACFDKDFNMAKGQTQKGEFDKWIEKFKDGNFFGSARSFDIYIDQANRLIFFTRIK